ncbi:MAG TPA: TM2 domain-containing protein [Flavobacteriaceae bacterium]|nr:TM2 domain-containing protein [Flavobacteriaceae bacterium]
MQVIDENGNPIPRETEESKRIIAGILGILLGAFGLHKFILGYTNQGITLLAITVITCGIGAAITSLIGLIEGIIYLTKSDEEFKYEYQVNKKEWF